jgi:formylglycine-generating enzyme required for sulfatase activity
MSSRVFISHASPNAALALRICEGLESAGLRCWIAPRDVRFDGTYGTEIINGLRDSDVFLIVISAAAAESEQVEREAERASHYKKRIIPVIVGRSEPGPRLEYYVAGRQHFVCSSVPDERFLNDLANAIRGQAPVLGAPAQPTPPPPPVHPSIRRNLLIPALAAVVIVAIAAYFFFKPAPSVPAAATNPPSEAVVTPPANAATTQPGKSAPPVPSERPSPPPTSPPAPAVREPAAGPTPVTPASGRGALATIVNGVGLRFASVPGGSFSMGCSAGDSDCEDDEKPVRRMSVDPFQISTTEVTQELWEAVMKNNPSDFNGATHPVEHVSWQDSQDFAEKLTQRRDGFTYRLPTEAEWEYAARAADPAPPQLTAVAWFGLAASSGRASRPQIVASKAPNRWGLHDMLGNVAEWCEDWYSPNYQRVVRGGSWVDSAKSLRFSARGKAVPTTRDYSIGVRLVRQPQP